MQGPWSPALRDYLAKHNRAYDALIFFTYLLNRVLGSFLSIAAVTFFIGLFQPMAPFQSSVTWYWLIYGYIVWELAHFVYHFLAHKVRLFWCLHSTHHAPETMNLFVSHAHFFLEAPYADTIRTSICILLGVSPPLLFLIMFIDGTWGTWIHAGEHVLKDGRMGVLNRWILTPSHHRVHHARNPLYIDTNYCNLLNVWDRAFGTLQPEETTVAPEYGITRPMKAGSFWDFYFGELVALGFEVLPSAANFIFARHPQHDAAQLAQALRKQSIIVRHFKLPRIDQFLRITVGADAECKALTEALRNILG